MVLFRARCRTRLSGPASSCYSDHGAIHSPEQQARIIMAYDGLQTETAKFRGHNGDMSEGYYTRPSRSGKVGGVIVIHGAGGWDEWVCETARKFAHNGFAAVAPNFFSRFGEGSSDDVAARARN